MKKILIIMLLMICFAGINYSSEEVFPGTIIGMSADDYDLYLAKHPPLDRLFRQGGIYYFLVDGNDLKKIETSGVTVLTRESASVYGVGAGPGETAVRLGGVNGAYHNYNETTALLRDLESRYPGTARVLTIGYSIEGRELNVIKISDNVGDEEEEPAIFIVGCHHAREWISVEVPLLFARYLLENYAGDSEVRRMVDNAQIYIMPLQNPDGLEFSIHTYRMWRKNRRYNGNFSWGVDPNRNYGYAWGYDDIGSSPEPDSYVYRGPGPFSEPETEAVRQFLLAHPPAGALSFHNYGQIILYPWGYTFDPAPDGAVMAAIAGEMAERISAVNGRVYTHGSSDATYPVNGSTIDWIYGTFGAPSFTIELPPEYIYEGGFFTPESLIDSAFRENLPAMLYFIDLFITESNGETIVPTVPRPRSPEPNEPALY